MEIVETVVSLLISLATAAMFLSEALKNLAEARKNKAINTSTQNLIVDSSFLTDSDSRSIASVKTRSRLGLVAVFGSISMLSFLQFGPGSHSALNAGDMASIAVSMQLFMGGIILLLRD